MTLLAPTLIFDTTLAIRVQLFSVIAHALAIEEAAAKAAAPAPKKPENGVDKPMHLVLRCWREMRESALALS